jgi:hypothetical protein
MVAALVGALALATTASLAEDIDTRIGKLSFENSYLRLYGPEQPAFDGTWKPGDFELVK